MAKARTKTQSKALARRVDPSVVSKKLLRQAEWDIAKMRGEADRAMSALNALLAKPQTESTLRPSVQPVKPLEDEPDLSDIGLQPLVLSAEAEAVLSEPIDEQLVLILPSGAVYYPHIAYTKWLNRAFGRAQWALVPAAKAKLTYASDDSKKKALATQLFKLFVHGKAVAQATGEQPYFEGNRDQTYADVLEALNASALRRVAKRLGIGLELWDRDWGRRWQAQYAVRVRVEGEQRPQWRRKVDPPLRGEQGGVERESRPEPASAPQRETREPQVSDSRKISEPQVKRLWAIARGAGRDEQELKGYLRVKWGLEHTTDITRGDYDRVIADIQRPGSLVSALEATESA